MTEHVIPDVPRQAARQPLTGEIFATDSQNAAILAHLQAGHRITGIDALVEFGCFRLGARIHELREAGHQITDEWITDPRNGKRFKRYAMEARA